jgi:hypothetical protein
MPLPFIHRDQVVVQRTVAVGFLDVEGTGLDGGGDLEKLYFPRFPPLSCG